MGKKENGFLIGVGVIVVAFIITQGIGNWFNPPNVVTIVDSDSRHFCPDHLSFNQFPYTTDFVVTYKNNGGGGNLISTVTSDIVIFKDANGKFEFEDSIDWIFDSGKETRRVYHAGLNNTRYGEEPKNLTINVSYVCYRGSKPINSNCGTGIRCCNYEKKQYSSSYTLTNELC